MIDFLVYGLEEYHGIIIVSHQSEGIRLAILHDLQRGVTVYKGRGGLSETEQDILYCVVTRLEMAKVKTIVEEIDDSAFVVVHHIADASGGTVKRRALH